MYIFCALCTMEYFEICPWFALGRVNFKWTNFHIILSKVSKLMQKSLGIHFSGNLWVIVIFFHFCTFTTQNFFFCHPPIFQLTDILYTTIVHKNTGIFTLNSLCPIWILKGKHQRNKLNWSQRCHWREGCHHWR